VEVQGKWEKLWENRVAGFSVIAIGISLCVYWVSAIPAPTTAVTVMGVAAAFMAARTNISGFEKAAWMILMFGLLFVEIKAIRKDRIDHDAEQAIIRKEENKNFHDIGSGIEGSIKESQIQFHATMDRIETTLKTSEATLRNTAPKAIVEFRDLQVQPSSLPPVAGHPLKFNVYFTNVGSETPTNVLYDVNFYLRQPDDIKAQREIAADFDKWWKPTKHSAPS
jgi:hypothetical protein